MEYIVQTSMAVLGAAWEVLLESSPFILFGFFIAGLLKGFIPDNFIQRHLGGKSKSGVLKSSLFGIPIPLCSCGVIPAAAGLREQGASKGAVTSFMISTPETGVDSMAVTYALLDPIMTVVRPVAAFFTAFVSGVCVNFLDKAEPQSAVPDNSLPKTENLTGTAILPMAELPNASSGCSSSGCGCGSQTGLEKDVSSEKGVFHKFRDGMGFAFGELLSDIGPWLMVGLFMAGIITVAVSPEFIATYLGDGILSMLVMIAFATPLYVCATASTPIAAALALKGLSPGAALVFLLAGPATNMATITVVSKLLGKKAASIYVGSIMVCSMILGLAVNWLYLGLGLDILGWVDSVGHEEHGLVYVLSALVLIVLIVKPWARGVYQKLNPSAKTMHPDPHQNCGCGH